MARRMTTARLTRKLQGNLLRQHEQWSRIIAVPNRDIC